MTKLKTWVYVFKRSLTDPSYYKELEKTKFSFSLKYLYLLLVFIFFVHSVRFAIEVFNVLPTLPAKISNFQNGMRKDYPEGLEIKIDKGELSTNAKEPLYINFTNTAKALDLKPDGTNFVTIDTSAQVEDYFTYKTLVLVTKKYIVAPDKENSYKLYPLSSGEENEGPISINKTLYLGLLDKADPYLSAIPNAIKLMAILGVTIFPFVAGGFSLWGKLIYLLVMTLFVLLMAKLMKKKYKYSTLFRLGMHGLTQPILVTFILGFFNIQYPWFYTGLFLVWMGVVLNKLK